MASYLPLWFHLGCVSRASWPEVYAACNLADVPDGLHAAFDSSDPQGLEVAITDACASALARSHGATLRSLEVDRLPIEDPTSIGEIVVAGLFDLAAANFGTTSDLVAIDGLSDTVARAIASFDEPEANAALFQYSSASTWKVSLTDEHAPGIWTHGGHVHVPTELTRLHPIRMATMLVHEASHHFSVPPHVECYDSRTGFPYCDEDTSGALGFDSAVEYSWIQQLAADDGIGVDACRTLCGEIALSQTCDLILDDDGYVPCATPECRDLCEPASD
jgi:hypothetical protein